MLTNQTIIGSKENERRNRQKIMKSCLIKTITVH